jgi:hypothetical protein
MARFTYAGWDDQVVPEMTAQDDIGGTLVLRPGQEYDFDGDPPGDPARWAAVPPPKALPAAKTPATTTTEG